MPRSASGEKGFTLLELLVVVLILAVIAAIIVPNVSSFVRAGNEVAANTEVQNLRTAAIAYRVDKDTWPARTDTAEFRSYYVPADYLRAVYLISNGLITGIDEAATDALANPWPDAIKFDADRQLWVPNR
jgi:prepilin-type N-terminal cleavage/methylation domain-containing protein